MKKLALGALLAGAIAACGGGGDVKLLDASLDALAACDPIAQTGCQAGEKCTWIVDFDSTPMQDEIGHIGCVPAGTLAEGAACDDPRANIDGGSDACAPGLLCIARNCKPICDLQRVPGSGGGACNTNFSCSAYSGVFVAGAAPTAGVCEPGCDPLTQELSVGTGPKAACGSPDPAMPSKTCVPGAGFRSFHCAPSGEGAWDLTDRKVPLLAPDGEPYGNGCAPGYIPNYFEDASGAMKTLCSGLCAPLDVDKELADAAATAPENPNPDLNAGDRDAIGKLVREPAPRVGDATCLVGVKGSVPQPNSEDCRYLWGAVTNIDPDAARMNASPYNDTVGICFNYAAFMTIDTTVPPDGRPDAFEKSCKELSRTTPETDRFGTPEQNGCYSLARTTATSATVRRNVHKVGRMRLGYGTALLTRHVFE